MLLSEIKQFTGGDLQCIADVEDDIQRNSTIRSFYTAHVCAADIYQFCQTDLGQTSLLAVVCDIQTELFVFAVLL